jgi:hypothetical protein
LGRDAHGVPIERDAQLGDLRQTVSRALRDAGFSVVVLAAIRERLDLEGRFVNAWIERTLL